MTRQKTASSRRRQSLRFAVLACLLIPLLCGGMATRLGFLRQVELFTIDMRFRQRPPITQSPHIGTIDIDRRTIEQSGSWPVTRRYYAAFLDVLDRYEAELMCFDLFFPDSGPLDVDRDLLQEAISLTTNATVVPGALRTCLSRMASHPDDQMETAMRNSRMTVMAQTFNVATGPGQAGTGKLTADHQESLQIIRRITSLPGHSAGKRSSGIPVAYTIEPPASRFAAASRGVGFAQIAEDIDGSVRKYALFMNHKGQLYPSTALVALSLASQVPLSSIDFSERGYIRIPGASLRDHDGMPETRDLRMPVDAQTRMMANWSGDYMSTFAHFPASLLLKFRATDLIRTRVHDYAGKIQELNPDAEQAIVNEVTLLRLLDRETTTFRTRRLVHAQWADVLRNQLGEKTPDKFMAAIADPSDEKAILEARGIWEQVDANEQLLAARLSGKTTDLPETGEYAGRIIDFIVRNKKDPDDWRPLYFFPPETVNYEGSTSSRTISPLDLEHKILYAGLTATGTHDMKPMPFNARYPMVGLHVNALNSMMTGQHLHELPPWVTLFAALVLTLITALLVLRARPLFGALYLVAALTAYTWAVFHAFSSRGWIVPLVAPVASALFAYLAIVVNRYILEQSEKQAVRNAFSMYMTPARVEQVLENPELLALGGTRRELTVFFSDLADFTSLSEGLEPEELVALINEYLDAMSSIILSHGGTLDKYEGDGIMAFWGAPIEQADHAQRACGAALECTRHLETTLASKWAKEGKPQLHVRIGINTGEVVVGNMGSSSRMDYTVMGDAVNLAARLEAANKVYATTIMIGSRTRTLIDDAYPCRELDAIRVKGKTQPETIYELMPTTADMDLAREFGDALALYRDRQWDAALKVLRSLESRYATDGPTQTAIERCLHYKETPPPEDWDRVWQLHSK